MKVEDIESALTVKDHQWAVLQMKCGKAILETGTWSTDGRGKLWKIKKGNLWVGNYPGEMKWFKWGNPCNTGATNIQHWLENAPNESTYSIHEDKDG